MELAFLSSPIMPSVGLHLKVVHVVHTANGLVTVRFNVGANIPMSRSASRNPSEALMNESVCRQWFFFSHRACSFRLVHDDERLERLVVALLCISTNHPATGSSWCWSGAQCPSFPGNVVRRLVKHPHSDTCVLKLRRHGQDGAVRLKDRYRDLRTSPHCDTDLRLLPVVNGQTFQ